jgi:hypothetical protein
MFSIDTKMAGTGQLFTVPVSASGVKVIDEIGMARFELTASCSQSRRATKLRYIPASVLRSFIYYPKMEYPCKLINYFVAASTKINILQYLYSAKMPVPFEFNCYDGFASDVIDSFVPRKSCWVG